MRPEDCEPYQGDVSRGIGMGSPLIISRSTDDLHPLIRVQATRLANDLDTAPFTFRVYETLRTPCRQTWLHETQGAVSRPWSSPHQYGLALDVVIYEPETNFYRFRLNINEADWLRATAAKRGLVINDPYRPHHVEYPGWDELKYYVGERE